MKHKFNAIHAVVFLVLIVSLVSCTQPNKMEPITGITGRVTNAVQYISAAVSTQYQADITAAEAPYNAEYAVLVDKLNKNQIGIDDFRTQTATINANKVNASNAVKRTYQAMYGGL